MVKIVSQICARSHDLIFPIGHVGWLRRAPSSAAKMKISSATVP
jgi:hypothetical protein